MKKVVVFLWCMGGSVAALYASQASKPNITFGVVAFEGKNYNLDALSDVLKARYRRIMLPDAENRDSKLKVFFGVLTPMAEPDSSRPQDNIDGELHSAQEQPTIAEEPRLCPSGCHPFGSACVCASEESSNGPLINSSIMLNQDEAFARALQAEFDAEMERSSSYGPAARAQTPPPPAPEPISARDAGAVEQEITCPICRNALEEDNPDQVFPLTKTSCGHTFHKKCLKRALKIKPTCPMCKTSLGSVPALPVQEEPIDDNVQRAIQESLAQPNPPQVFVQPLQAVDDFNLDRSLVASSMGQPVAVPQKDEDAMMLQRALEESMRLAQEEEAAELKAMLADIARMEQQEAAERELITRLLSQLADYKKHRLVLLAEGMGLGQLLASVLKRADITERQIIDLFTAKGPEWDVFLRRYIRDEQLFNDFIMLLNDVLDNYYNARS